MRRLGRRVYFKKLDSKNSRWTRGRACFKLPGRIIVTPTNFSSISYLNLEEYSYNYYCGDDYTGNMPNVIAEEYLQYKYTRNRDSGKNKELKDIELRHFNETKSFMTYEYDMHVLKHLKKSWDSQKLKKYLKYYRSCKFDFQRSSIVYSSFTNLLNKYCTNSVLIVNFFRVICKHIFTCENIFMGSTAYLELFLKHSVKVGYDPWSLLLKFQKLKDSPVMEFCPVEWSLINGNIDHLTLLLKYGCPFAASNCTVHMFNKKIDGRFWNRNRSIPIVMPADLTSLTNEEPTSKTCFRKSSTFFAHFTVTLFLCMSNALICGEDQRKRFIQSASLFMRSVPESYVSHEDMLKIVSNLAPSLEWLVTNSCELYRVSFPRESSGPRRPRSLMHLSRCAVRQRCLLPDGVSILPVPDHLRSYLSLEW